MDFKAVKTFLFFITFIALSIIGIVYCSSPHSPVNSSDDHSELIISETFHTERDENKNVDSPALWHGPEGQNWVLATAKEGHSIVVFDAGNGKKIASFGEPGNGRGQLKRPNGIAVIDSFAIIVERDNHRLQVFSLPSFQSLGFFGQDHLIRPYGIAVDQTENGYELYITDNYEMADETLPPPDSLDHRVHHFQMEVDTGHVKARHMNAFGDTRGDGVLYKVESILVDRPLNRLLIADEYEMQRNIKIYTTAGEFTGKVIPHKYFYYEPEGIALWACESDTSGYYITTDQDVLNNFFPVFDRKSLAYQGRFAGKITRNTDGVALSQHAFGPFEYGAFYPVHDDGSITAMDWTAIADSLNLRKSCQ